MYINFKKSARECGGVEIMLHIRNPLNFPQKSRDVLAMRTQEVKSNVNFLPVVWTSKTDRNLSMAG